MKRLAFLRPVAGYLAGFWGAVIVAPLVLGAEPWGLTLPAVGLSIATILSAHATDRDRRDAESAAYAEGYLDGRTEHSRRVL